MIDQSEIGNNSQITFITFFWGSFKPKQICIFGSSQQSSNILIRSNVIIAPHSRFSVEGGGLPLATGDALRCDDYV
jgi:hypothetical protein